MQKKQNKHGERLIRIVEAFPRIAVSVLGDMVADEFIFGEISRVSREAPVLILKHRERTVVPGGAANAVYNLADLGVSVLPIGVVGDDEPGKLLLQSFRTKKIPLSGILKLKGYTTVTKTRILAGHTHTARQQVVRVDREPASAIPAEVSRRLAIDAREYAPASDALLVSDYGYGAATPEVLTAVRAKRSFERLPITLDSRYRMLNYSGITAATPNEAEVEQALGLRLGDDIERVKLAGKNLIQRMKLESLLITRGRHGMVSFARGHKPVEIPIYGSDEVTDVTGAGDTVIAAFTAALAAGADSESAAHVANYAGGIVVMKRGTATVSQRELLDAIEHG
jgi:rfaE bifunctional protein kinase chain/domain